MTNDYYPDMMQALKTHEDQTSNSYIKPKMIGNESSSKTNTRIIASQNLSGTDNNIHSKFMKIKMPVEKIEINPIIKTTSHGVIAIKESQEGKDSQQYKYKTVMGHQKLESASGALMIKGNQMKRESGIVAEIMRV